MVGVVLGLHALGRSGGMPGGQSESEWVGIGRNRGFSDTFLVGSHLQEDMCLFSDHSVLIQGSIYVVDWDRGLEGGGFNVVLSDKVSIHKHACGV